MDTNLSERELFLIRRLYRRHQNSKVSSCVGVLLQNLWGSYGSVFADKTLLYAALAFESYWNDYDMKTWSQSGTAEYHIFKSRFNRSLWHAIERNKVSECHFFALFLASQSSKSGVTMFKQDLAVYQEGMVKVLKFLNQPSKGGGFRPLHQHHSFILSFTRRIMCRGDFSMPEYVVADVAATPLPELEVQQVANRLPIATSLREMHPPMALPSNCEEHRIDLHKWDYWNDIICCLCNEFQAMSECFQILINPAQQSEECHERVAHTITRARKKVDKMLNLHDISYVFKYVHPSLIKFLTC